jgi:predicted HTH transcriptional regulator
LLLGKSIQRYRPVFTIKGVSFVGNSVATTEFRDKLPDREVEGNLLKQYEASISFINRNLKTVQIEKEFNSAGQLEIPLEVFVETLTNAFIHRDYYINSPIRLFIFDNRIEIHSPGILPDSVTEETIKKGISVPRNQLLFDNARHLLPYTGIGSGIMRAMKSYDKILFENNISTGEFVITIMRDETLNADTVNSENDTVNGENEGVNDVFEGVKLKIEGVTNKLNQELGIIYGLIKENPLIKTAAIKQLNNKSNATIERYLKILKDNELIEYVGSDKTGGYMIKTL